MKETYVFADQTSQVPFQNHVEDCVGTGRMGLALQHEYQKQLKLVQEEIGFRHIRGHGLFCDDMAIFQMREEDGHSVIEYNFTYLDLVMDCYRDLHIRPFLELGFMPEKLARGTQTVFYWKGNVTPPKNYEDWCQLVQATLRHLMERYGAEEVVTWPVEIWNEPNLPGFFENADMQEYFRLFHKTFAAVKEVDPRFQVGGPAICGGGENWIAPFLSYCVKQHLAIDFVSRHHYTTDVPERAGHYGYAALRDPEAGFAVLDETRKTIDRFPEYNGLPMYITEFNTSYIPNCPLHDTNQNAAYIAHLLSRLGDVSESYSYWTFGDIFEENGVPFTPFHGGFGLVANGGIKKPTFYSFAFFKRLKKHGGHCIFRNENCVICYHEEKGYAGIFWNDSLTRTGEALSIHLSLETLGETYSLITERVEEASCNPLHLWHCMGEPASLSDSAQKLLQQAAVPRTDAALICAQTDRTELDFTLSEHGLMYMTLSPVCMHSDAGYDYSRVMQKPKEDN